MDGFAGPDEIEPTKFHDLPFSEQLVIWGVRLWVHGAKEGVEIHSTLTEGFEKVNATGACAALDRFMSVLAAGAIDTIDVRCRKCLNVSPDEHRILGVLAAWQCTGIGDDAETLLSKILTPTGVRIAQKPACDLAQSMKFAAMLIRPRRESPSSPSAVAGHDLSPSVPGTIH